MADTTVSSVTPGEVRHPDAWRLALVAGDDVAMRVLAAWYTTPRKQRENIEKIADLADVPRVFGILRRLRAVGLLVDQQSPPPVVLALLNKFASARMSGNDSRRR